MHTVGRHLDQARAGDGSDLELLDPGAVAPFERGHDVTGEPLLRLDDGDGVSLGGERFRDGQADLAAAQHYDTAARILLAEGDIERVENLAVILDRRQGGAMA